MNKDRALADEKKAKVAKDEAAVKKTADEVQAIADDAKADLAAAMPALQGAIQALNSLSKNDIVEIKNFKTPPPLVQKVMEGVCILLGAKPDWDSAKKVLGDTQFMNRLLNFDKVRVCARACVCACLRVAVTSLLPQGLVELGSKLQQLLGAPARALATAISKIPLGTKFTNNR